MPIQPNPFSYGPAGPSAARRPGPSKWWYVVGVVLLLVSVGGAIGIGWSGMSGMPGAVRGLQRVQVPGTSEIRFDAAGNYTVYLEYAGASSRPYPGDGTVRLTDSSGRPVSMRKYTSQVTYHVTGHEGRAALSFTISRPGTYHLTTAGSPDLTIAIGTGLGGSITGTVVGAILAGLFGSLIAIVILVTTAILSNVAARRSASGSSRGGYPGPGPVMPGPPHM